MTDVAVGTLRLRGQGAQRLAHIAATSLPAALERALADVDDVSIPAIGVRLDLAIEDYDDETLALLWADAIRTRVLETTGGRATTASHGRRAVVAGHAAEQSDAGPDAVAAAVRHWIAAARDGPLDLPAAVVALADPQLAASVRRQLSANEWHRLVATLTLALAPGAVRSEAAATPPAAARPEPGNAAPDASTDPAGMAVADNGPATDPTPQPAAAEPWMDGEEEAFAQLAAVAQLAPVGTDAIDLTALTRAAGLALLYPWLADHCRYAESLHPDLDPVEVREAALAAVVDPEDPTLCGDPFICLLAGRPPDHGRDLPVRRRLPGTADVARSAGEVLGSFSALLPGFDTSSAAFIRASWIARDGLLDTGHDPVLLAAATHPLDVVLPRLPYTVGLLKLPWSPLVSVVFR